MPHFFQLKCFSLCFRVCTELHCRKNNELLKITSQLNKEGN